LSKLPTISGAQAVRAFERLGYEVDHQRGSHIEALFIVAFPLYLANRRKLRTKQGSTSLWLLTLASGALLVLLFALWVLGLAL
jgi:hypothetical protein